MVIFIIDLETFPFSYEMLTFMKVGRQTVENTESLVTSLSYFVSFGGPREGLFALVFEVGSPAAQQISH